MEKTPIALSKSEIAELVKISNLEQMELSLEQWELIGRLTGALLSQIRECFVESHDTHAILLNIQSINNLPSVDDIANHVPFFRDRI